MYLLQLDERTGLIKDDVNNDGWKAIKIFREVVKKDGIEGLTLVALSCDYLSPLNAYSDKDRPYRAMDEIFDSRKKINIESELYKSAFLKYKTLQRNNDLEFEIINNRIEYSLMDRYEQESFSEEPDMSSLSQIHVELTKHKERVAKFKETFNKEETIEKFGVAKNGYVLSRIENDIRTRRKSKFSNPEKELENPNKLGLIDEEPEIKDISVKPEKKKLKEIKKEK